jgi:hypothetical protein
MGTSRGMIKMRLTAKNPLFFAILSTPIIKGELRLRRAHNPKVVGSNPTPATNSNSLICKEFVIIRPPDRIETRTHASISSENGPVTA